MSSFLSSFNVKSTTCHFIEDLVNFRNCHKWILHSKVLKSPYEISSSYLMPKPPRGVLVPKCAAMCDQGYLEPWTRKGKKISTFSLGFSCIHKFDLFAAEFSRVTQGGVRKKFQEGIFCTNFESIWRFARQMNDKRQATSDKLTSNQIEIEHSNDDVS